MLLVEFGCGPPLKLDGAQRSNIGELKPKQEWDKLDNENSEINVLALYNIYNGVNSSEFHRMATCKWVKEASDIFLMTHEGTFAAKLSKI